MPACLYPNWPERSYEFLWYYDPFEREKKEAGVLCPIILAPWLVCVWKTNFLISFSNRRATTQQVIDRAETTGPPPTPYNAIRARARGRRTIDGLLFFVEITGGTIHRKWACRSSLYFSEVQTIALNFSTLDCTVMTVLEKKRDGVWMDGSVWFHPLPFTNSFLFCCLSIRQTVEILRNVVDCANRWSNKSRTRADCLQNA